MGIIGWTSAHRQAGDMSWMDQAACLGADPDLFAECESRPTWADGQRVLRAWEFCVQCPVAGQCLVFGRGDRASGVYGGMLLSGGNFVNINKTINRRPPKKRPKDKTGGDQ